MDSSFMARRVVEVRVQTEESGGWKSFPAAPSITLVLLATAWGQSSESECLTSHVSVRHIF